jgi:acetoacetyl-CoA synthetase
LGLDVQAQGAVDADGGGAPGELICRNPFPSRPLGFHGDPNGERFHETYFSQNEGVWSHGDLIEFTREGTARLHGRVDGVLNVNGVRIGPAEIDGILRDIPGLIDTMAVEQPVPGDIGRSRLVLLVILADGVLLDGTLKRRIRRELSTRASSAHVPEIIVAVPEFPYTHSGKRADKAVREALAGKSASSASALRNPSSVLRIVSLVEAEDRCRSSSCNRQAGASLEASLTSIWERVLDVSPISRDESFFDLGGTSLRALEMLNILREETGREVPPSLLFEAPTIARLSLLLEEQASAFSPLVEVSSTGSGTPLLLVHGLAGDALELRALTTALSSKRPVSCFRARGLDGREPPHTTVEEMAQYYCEHLRRRNITGPFCLAGYSYGGLVAYEMARLLAGSGERVDFVGLIDSDLADECLPFVRRTVFRARRKAHRVLYRLSRKAGSSSWIVRKLLESLERSMGATRSDPLTQLWRSEAMTPQMKHIEAISWSAFRAFRPKRSAVPVVFFRSTSRPPTFHDPVPLWREFASADLEVIDVPGDHFSMIRQPEVRVLAERIDAWLSEAGKDAAMLTEGVDTAARLQLAGNSV